MYDDDEDSLADDVVSTLKLNVLIGIVVLLVISAVGTAMLLSISKIWGNHRENVWLENQALVMKGLDRYRDHSTDEDEKLLHPKDLSSILFQYEIARTRHHRKNKLHHEILHRAKVEENLKKLEEIENIENTNSTAITD